MLSEPVSNSPSNRAQMDAAVFGIVGAIGQGCQRTFERLQRTFHPPQIRPGQHAPWFGLRQHISPMIVHCIDGLGEFGVIGEEPCWAET